MHFNMLDYVTVVVLFISIAIGVVRGFLREAISLVAWSAGFIAALKFSPRVGYLLHDFISHQGVRHFVAGLMIFVLALIVGVIVNKVVHSLVCATGFGFVDHFLGLIFGAARGVLCVTMILILISLTAYQNAGWVNQSVLAPRFRPAVNYFMPMVPKSMKTARNIILKQLGANSDVTFAVLTA